MKKIFIYLTLTSVLMICSSCAIKKTCCENRAPTVACWPIHININPCSDGEYAIDLFE